MQDLRGVAGPAEHARRGAVYADITWVGYTGRDVPDRMTKAFTAVRDARDAAFELVRSRVRADKDVRGFEVDRAASSVLSRAGYAAQIGTGVNMDDYETHDDRRLLPGTGFTIEPGVYFPDFGIRSEINVIVQARDAVATGPLQNELLHLV
jgi:Xaa-Pro aminopeptidase